MNIYEKLSLIQSELKCNKGQYNSFGKYHYRSCEDILEGVKPLLNKYKVAITLDDHIVQIGDRYYIQATATLIDTVEGDKISTNALARESENKKNFDESQLTGSTSSYARKYALNGLFAIDDTKDSDTTNNGSQSNAEGDNVPNKSSNSGQLTEKQINRLYSIAYSKGVLRGTVKKHIHQKFHKDIENLTRKEYDKVIEGYEKMDTK